MPEVIRVRFKPCGKMYDFEINDIEVNKGDLVVVESKLGLSIGSAISERHEVGNPEKELKKIIRKATDEDLHQKQENEKLETEARDYCLERIMARGLPMKLIYTEVTLDRKRIVFYFTAEGRIDFRELVKDLAAKFKTRIEMRQIGVRDEAKILGGIGICGKELCCKKFLTSFEPISIKMAKRQELVLNTSKLSGVCGRLMCCLGYEYDETSLRDAILTEENPVSISEDAEMLEIIADEPEIVITTSQPPEHKDDISPERNESIERYKKFPRHKRRRKRRFRKK
ncbi:MAG: stage 0 sporulation family protein [Nitrospirota bacterium]